MRPKPLARQVVTAEAGPGCWRLAPNDVWDVPADVSRVHFETEHWPGPHAPLKSLRGLAMDKYGHVYGMRTLSNHKGAGYVVEGRVSVGGQSYPAFTGWRMFQRPDGSLVNVAVLIVCRGDAP